MSFHLVIGYRPAGAETARQLAAQGTEVRVVTRSTRPVEPGIDHVALDVTDTTGLIGVAEGAVAIHNCAAPPLHRWSAEWPPLAASVTAAAEASGAVLVMLGNLYGYGPVDGEITEDLPMKPAGADLGKRPGGTRERPHPGGRGARVGLLRTWRDRRRALGGPGGAVGVAGQIRSGSWRSRHATQLDLCP